MNDAKFNLKVSMAKPSDLAQAGVEEEYSNPLLTWIKLVFADDQPNRNNEGISQEEFPSLIQSMAYMPIKANYSESGLEGHTGAVQVGVIKAGQPEDSKIVTVGALYKDEFPDVVDYFKQEFDSGNSINFSWEIRYKDSEEIDGVNWLKGTTTKAVTAVENPAYGGRTPLVSISATDIVNAIDEELKTRGVEV